MQKSREQWKDWVESIVDQREKVFTSDPDDMVGAYRREVGYSNDYRGRELLELLQNADDASPGEPRTQRATLILCEEGLCFANTGEPFSEGGIKSLIVSNNSPKKRGEAKYIGNRGLGFRSVLGWTNSPFILSGNLSVGFDRRRAEQWLEDLANRDEGVQRKVEEERQASGLMPIPTLAIPAILDEQDTASSSPSEEPNFVAIWALANSLRAEGYDTVIALPFTEPNAFKEARAQLERTGREVLLFLRHIGELVIRSPQGQTKWIAQGSDSSVEISSDEEGQPPSRWEVLAEAGTIPDAYLRRDQMETPDYEIKLAIPSEDTKVPGALFNYFPTRIHFPFPLIAHTTLELTSNRENLADSRANRYLLQELARFMAETAESIARESDHGSEPWTPLSLVTPRGDLDPVMQELEFRETLVEDVASRELVPVRDGRKLAPAEARRLGVASAAWLPEQGFEDVVVDSDDRWLIEMVEELGTALVSPEELRERLNLCSGTLSVAVRASLVAELVKSGLMPDPPPKLLTDRLNTTIEAGTTPFLPPAGGAFDLPIWVEARVLHAGLVEALRTEFGGINAAGLAARLSVFGVQTYSVRELARHIDRATEHKVLEQPEWEGNYRLAGLSALFQVYAQSSRSDEQAAAGRQADLRVKLPTREGSYISANALYFGQEYPRGDLTELFYGRYSPEKLVAPPDALRLGDNKAAIGDFLAWLGVASEPRQTEKTEVCDQQFLRYVRDQLNYPAYFGEEIVESADSLAAYPDLHVADALWVDGLDRVLEEPDPYAIVYWLASNRRLEDWQRSDTSAKLRLTSQDKRAVRSLKGQMIPSYVMWLLQQAQWLPASDRTWRAPVECTLAPNLPEKAKPILPRPNLSEADETFQRLGVNRTTIRRALYLVGVNFSVDDLSWDDFYDLLFRLPELDPNGNHARAVYRLLLSRTDETEIESSGFRRRFLNEGGLWARHGGSAGYCRVSEGVYYADDPTIPGAVQEMPTLDLERGRGSQKVARFFGAKPFSNLDIVVEIDCDRVDPHPREADLKAEVEQLKPYVYAMRQSADDQARGLDRLRNLSIVLCQGAAGTVIMRDEEHNREHTAQISLTEGESILEPKGETPSEGETAYLCTKADGLSESRMLTDDIAYDVGIILANVLGVENVGDFAALAQCSPSRRFARLQKMLGTDSQELLDEADRKLELGPETELEDKPGGEGWPPSQDSNGGNQGDRETGGGGENTKGRSNGDSTGEVTVGFKERLELLDQGYVPPVHPIFLSPGGEEGGNAGGNGGNNRSSGPMPVAQIKVGEGKKREHGDEGEQWALAMAIRELKGISEKARGTAIDAIVELLNRFKGTPVDQALAHATDARKCDLDEESQINALSGLLHVSQYSDTFGFDMIGWLPSGGGSGRKAVYLEVKSSSGGEFHLSRGEWSLAERLYNKGMGDQYEVLVVRRAGSGGPPDAMHRLSDPVRLVKSGHLSSEVDGYHITYRTGDL